MRNFMLGLLGIGVLATLSVPDAALARRWDHPDSGICPGNLVRVNNLRACALFDREGHRIPGAQPVPEAEFKQYGISRLHVP
jgi:hypothetical protein